MFPSSHPLMLRCQTSPSMWHSAITRSLDYTFISFEMVTYYESDRFTPEGVALPSLAPARSRYGGSLHSMHSAIFHAKCEARQDLA
jgi:hypothetical protein